MVRAEYLSPAATDVHIPHTGDVFRMPALKILRASHRPLKWWQPVDSRLPVRSLMASVPCGRNRPPNEQRIAMNTRIIV